MAKVAQAVEAVEMGATAVAVLILEVAAGAVVHQKFAEALIDWWLRTVAAAAALLAACVAGSMEAPVLVAAAAAAMVTPETWVRLPMTVAVGVATLSVVVAVKAAPVLTRVLVAAYGALVPERRTVAMVATDRWNYLGFDLLLA